MKRYHSIALVLVLTMSLMAGCSSPMDDGGSTTGVGTPTTPTTLPAGTLMTEPSSQPTEPSETITIPSEGQTLPTDAGNGSSDPMGRGRPMR